jgi:hypothetical protein
MKLDTRWLDWQPSADKFEKSAEASPSKPAKKISEGFVGAESGKFRNVFFLEAAPAAYEDGLCWWAQERCMFLDRSWWGIGALHRDYFAWCRRTGADVPGSLDTFRVLLRDCGFTITDDGLVCGLALTEDLQKIANPEPSKPTKKIGRR